MEFSGNNVNSSAIGSDGTIYVGSDDNKLYAINGETGVKLWEFEAGDWVLHFISSDGTDSVGSRDNKLYAINGQTGDKLWEFEAGGRMAFSSPPSVLMARFHRVRGQKALRHQWPDWGQAMGI